jgi:hypothetical protein
MVLGVACESSPVRHPATPDEVASLCAGIPDSERDHPSALQPPELEAVRSAMGERRLIKLTVPELRGAELLVRPNPGVSKQWLTRVVRCHVAYHDIAGPRLQESSPDPLVVDGSEITVDDTDTSFVIRIKGANKAEGQEILARAQRLVSSTPSASSATR